MKYFSHINSAINILHGYNGQEPFSHFIKNFFKQNKKFGSTDRRTIGHLCYCYFRLGHALKEISIEEKILTGIFLCNQEHNELLNHFKPEWNTNVDLPLEQKLSIINHQFLITDIFPWKDELSEGIDHEKFCRSFLIQPDLFLRIRPRNEKIVLAKLTEAKIEFRQLNHSCIALNNSTKLEGIIDINKEAVIQDYNSQQVVNFFEQQTANKQQTAWDCCAASGGKSIMLYDSNPNIDLTVSDIRKSILENLRKRFSEAGIRKYHSFSTDLSVTSCKPQSASFDLVIADVPCSGSGTWSRTPESLFYFDKIEIEKYGALQKKIVSNVIPSVKKGGTLVYVTCSVFKKENEAVVDVIQKESSMKLKEMTLLKGYEQKADSMFVASFEAV